MEVFELNIMVSKHHNDDFYIAESVIHGWLKLGETPEMAVNSLIKELNINKLYKQGNIKSNISRRLKK